MLFKKYKYDYYSSNNIVRRNKIVLLFSCFFFGINLIAQEADELNKNIVYIEGATKGTFYSLNYEHIFRVREKLAWSYRVGGFVGKDGIALPLGINAITGKHEHHAEISFVATPYIDHYHSLWNGKNSADKYLYLSPALGYRYQKPAGKLYCKISAGPLLFLDPPSDDFWKMNPKWFVAGYLSAGISFN